MPTLARRAWLVLLSASLAPAPNAAANPALPDDVELATNLPQLAQRLGAADALPSTHLLLAAPDVSLPGAIPIQLRSDLPGTSLMVLARGRFTTTPGSGNASPSGAINLAARKSVGEFTPPERLQRTVWLATLPFAAGEPAQASLTVPIEATQTLTLFAHAQGRWWFVTREVKLGRAVSPR